MPHHIVPSHIKERARLLRKKQTPTEKTLWTYLRNRKQDGMKRYRQHPICIGSDGLYKRYIADFRCAALQLVIEIDGGYHQDETQQEYDTIRADRIQGLGIGVLRFTNEQVENNIEGVLHAIREYTK